MKQILLILLTLVFISCKSEKKGEQAILKSKTEVGEQIDEYFKALKKLGKFNGVVYAVKDDGEILHKAYNLNQDRTSTTFVTPNSQFDIHSVSKLMAHYIIEKFEIERKLKKSQPINEFIDNFPNLDGLSFSFPISTTSL